MNIICKILTQNTSKLLNSIKFELQCNHNKQKIFAKQSAIKLNLQKCITHIFVILNILNLIAFVHYFSYAKLIIKYKNK